MSGRGRLLAARIVRQNFHTSRSYILCASVKEPMVRSRVTAQPEVDDERQSESPELVADASGFNDGNSGGHHGFNRLDVGALSRRSARQPEQDRTAGANHFHIATASTSPSTPAPRLKGTSQYPINLTAGQTVKVKESVYQILETQLDQRASGKLSLKFSVRITNNLPYAINVSGNSFRLLVDGVPRAPVNELTKRVESRSAEEGDVEFSVPATAENLVLRIGESSDPTEVVEVPIDLNAAVP